MCDALLRMKDSLRVTSGNTRVSRSRQVLRSCVHLALSCCSPIESEKLSHLERAPALIWNGVGRSMSFSKTRAPNKPVSLKQLLLQRLVVHLYATDDRSQQQNIVGTLCDMLQYVVGDCAMVSVPANIVDILIVFSIATKRLFQDPAYQQKGPTPQRVSKEMRSIFNAEKNNISSLHTNSGNGLQDSVRKNVPPAPPEALECHVSADDLGSAFSYLHSQCKHDVLLLMNCMPNYDLEEHVKGAAHGSSLQTEQVQFSDKNMPNSFSEQISLQDHSQMCEYQLLQLQRQSCKQGHELLIMALESSSQELEKHVRELEFSNCEQLEQHGRELGIHRSQLEAYQKDMVDHIHSLDTSLALLQSRMRELQNYSHEFQDCSHALQTTGEELERLLLPPNSPPSPLPPPPPPPLLPPPMPMPVLMPTAPMPAPMCVHSKQLHREDGNLHQQVSRPQEKSRAL